MVNEWYDGYLSPEVLLMESRLDLQDLGIAFDKLAEALSIEMNWPRERKYTHAELADSFRAIRQVNAEREGK